MALPLFPQEENSVDKLSRSLNTGLGNGIQTLAQSNLERMLGRNNYFQQNLSEALKGLESKPQPSLGNLIAQQPIAQPQQVQQQQIQPSPQQEEKVKYSPAQQLKREELDIRTSKEARNWLNTYREKAQEADRLKSNFKLMGEAGRSKDMYIGPLQRLAERVGVDYLTTNSVSQIFDKLSNEAKLHVAKVALPKGSKITNLIEQMSSKTLPSREMDRPAMVALSAAGEELMKLAGLEYEVADKKLSEWGGKLPYNADSQVDKELAKRKKEIQKNAKNILRKGIKGEIYMKPPEVGSSFSSMSDIPTQDLKAGRRLRDNETGKIYEWTGKDWKESGV